MDVEVSKCRGEGHGARNLLYTIYIHKGRAQYFFFGHAGSDMGRAAGRDLVVAVDPWGH